MSEYRLPVKTMQASKPPIKSSTIIWLTLSLLNTLKNVNRPVEMLKKATLNAGMERKGIVAKAGWSTGCP
ncbi:MAG: hypothetical protein N3F08_03655 [Crenarchaeota archaeon]|nr:hypothetical protein [Thermoproteota archaeon]